MLRPLLSLGAVWTLLLLSGCNYGGATGDTAASGPETPPAGGESGSGDEGNIADGGGVPADGRDTPPNEAYQPIPTDDLGQIMVNGAPRLAKTSLAAIPVSGIELDGPLVYDLSRDEILYNNRTYVYTEGVPRLESPIFLGEGGRLYKNDIGQYFRVFDLNRVRQQKNGTDSLNISENVLFQKYSFYHVLESEGYAGMVSPQDGPMTGTATFSGAGYVRGRARAGIADAEDLVDAQLKVDFGAGTADLDIGQLYLFGLNANRIQIEGMRVNGRKFSGGTLRMMQNAMNMTDQLLSDTAQVTADGAFFGYEGMLQKPMGASGGFAVDDSSGKGVKLHGVYSVE